MKRNLSRKSDKPFRLHSLKALEFHAAPLMELKERDWKAMVELFERKDSDDIEADINNNLKFLFPEPCWEEEPFDFLQEYL